VDLGSRNGTRVNGTKVEAKGLTKGDTIVTGFATITVKEIAFPGSNGKIKARQAPARPASKPASARLSPATGQGSGRIKVHRGPREMPLGLLDYLLILVILGLILYILGVLFFALKERGLPVGPAEENGTTLGR
jgi:hypothetical protein